MKKVERNPFLILDGNPRSQVLLRQRVPVVQWTERKGHRFSALSFHSLRHTMISRLANTDALETVTKAMSEHSTDEAHRRYVHLDTEAQSRVMAKAPRLWNKGPTVAKTVQQ